MKCFRCAIALPVVLILSSCGQPAQEAKEITAKVYVIAPDGRSSSFIEHLALIVRRYRLEPNVGSATDDKGGRLNVLDAKGRNVRLRSENVLLSGQEDPSKCGAHDEPYSDPGQYFISVFTSGAPDGDEGAKNLLAMISSDLRNDGYDVSSKPRLCSKYRR